MRRKSELWPNARGMAFSKRGWAGTAVTVGTVQGGSNESLPTALAVLAASEARSLFWLVKLSGCRDHVGPEGQGFSDGSE